MSNKLDPIHAVAQMALALVEIQKDLGLLHRQFAQITESIVKVDSAVAVKFGQVDKSLNYCLQKVNTIGGNNAADGQGQKDNGVDEKDVRAEEGEGSVLCDGERKEAQGCPQDKQEE